MIVLLLSSELELQVKAWWKKKIYPFGSAKKLSDTKVTLEELNIYPPFDGIIGFFKLREGSEVNVGSTIVNFYDPKSLVVEFYLPISTAKQLNDGTPILINNKEYKLTHVQKMIDEETTTCPAYAEINCSDCIIGTAVDVSITVVEKTNVIVIPFEAVFLRKGKSFVYIVKKNQAP